MYSFIVDDITVYITHGYDFNPNRKSNNAIYVNINYSNLRYDCTDVDCGVCPFGSGCSGLRTVDALNKYAPDFVATHPEYFI